MIKNYFNLLKKTSLVFILSLTYLASFGQSQIKGKVVDQNSAGMGPVNIFNKTQNTNTSTTGQGDFTLSANIGDVLVFTFVGYETETVTVQDFSFLGVFMFSTTEELDEFVVVGYGTIKKSELTGSVSRLDKKVLETGVRANPASALAGTVPGLRVTQTSGRPGSVPSIVLRGGTSYTGGGSPLVIVDGIVRNSFSDINQDDIETIDVLKDASATAIYGARAANGVILITTKRGKDGASNITFRSKTGFNTINLPYKFLDAEDYIYWSRKAVQNSGQYDAGRLSQLNSAGPFGTGNLYKDANGNILDGNVNGNAVWSTMFLDDSNRELLSQGWKTMKDPVTGRDLIFKDFNYADYALNKTAITQDYNVGLTGGNDKGKYYASVGKYHEQGMPVNTFYDRLSFVFNGDYKIKSWLTSNSGLNFVNTGWRDAINGEGNYMGRALGAPPTMRGFNENGDLLVGRDFRDGNPQVNDDKFIRKNETQKFALSQGFIVNFLENLSLRTTANWFYDQGFNEAFDRDYLNNPGNIVRTRSSSASYGRTLNQTYNAILNYTNRFAEKHNTDIMLGWEFFDTFSKGMSASGSGAPTDDFMDLGLTNSGENRRSIDSYHNGRRINSFFGRLNYNYEQRYLATFTVRRDGYSTLLDHRWGTFPGVSLGWNLHNEDFFDNTLGAGGILNSLKLRASIGANGDVGGIGNYTLQGAYGTNNYNGSVGYLMSSLSIPGLRWESLVTKELGFDARLFKTLDLTVDYYHRTTSDKIATLQLPVSAGFTSITTNNGDMQNQGVEISLNYRVPMNNRDWDVSFNWNTAYNKNKILKLPDNGVENNRQGGFQVYDPQTKQLIWVGGLQEGQDPNVAYAYEALGIIRTQADLDNYARNLVDQMGYRRLVHPDVYRDMSPQDQANHYPIALGDVMWRDVNGDGIINQFDRVYVGKTVPAWTGGFGAQASWKNLTLSTRMDYALGYMAFDGSKMWFQGNMQGTFNTTTDVFDTWTPENPNAKYPSYYWADQLFKYNTSRTSTMFYNKGDYLALREVNLAYRLPTNLANKIKAEDLSLSITGQNLHYWTKNTTFSAESNFVGEGGGGYPLPRTVILGLQLTF